MYRGVHDVIAGCTMCCRLCLLQEKDAEAGCLRQELAAMQEDAASWQRRCKQLQSESDGRELELARRDLHAKVGREPSLSRKKMGGRKWEEGRTFRVTLQPCVERDELQEGRRVGLGACEASEGFA